MKSRIIWFFLFALMLSGCEKEKTVEETCSDGIQNQGETGVDCGGPCAPCSQPTGARDSVIWDYNTNYLSTSLSSPGWTGSTTGCNAGSVPQSTHDKVIQRINYFRRLVGLNDNTTLDASQFSKYQQTALMMTANAALNHYPPNTWTCWTQSGYDGATQSNLGSSHSVNAVTSFMRDLGASNVDVGHRRWILHSSKTQFSYGTTNSHMALGVIGVAGGNTVIPLFIAYPPEGYAPQPLVFPRWSFGIPLANFSSANVSMTGPSGNVPLTIVSRTASYGDRTIVWEPQGIILNSDTDVQYTVTVSGIANAPETSYTYTVIIVKP